MMKRIIAVFFCVAVVFSLAVIPVSAENETPKVTVEFVNIFYGETFISEDGKELFAIGYTQSVPVVGQKCNISVALDDFESLSSGNMKIKYNSQTVNYKGDSEPLEGTYDDFDHPYTWERDYLKAEVISESAGLYEYEIIADGREFKQTTLCTLEFETIALGTFDFEIEFSDLKDKDGNEINFETEIIEIPLYTHTEDELPDTPVLDQEKCLTYGMALSMEYVKTELAYPMTVGEFIDSVDCDTGYGIIVDCDGNVLDRDDPVPTGATFKQCYDNAAMFETTLTVIGDVTCDGKITAADARKILRITAKLEKVGNDDVGTAIQNAANPAQGQNMIEAKDARAVLRYAAGLEDSYAEWYRYHCLLKKYSYGLYNTNL